MIDLLLNWASSGQGPDALEQRLAARVATVKASAGRGDGAQVAQIERIVQADPEGCFGFSPDGSATLQAGTRVFPAGRFETPSIGTLRQRALSRAGASRAARSRLWVLLGASPATDIGSLQATARPGTVFQVASQFNCLEAPCAFITPVADYFDDNTQGPRAAISAFPGTFVRHYAAPAQDGTRFVQQTDGPQLNLLEAACEPGVARVRNGYLRAADISDPALFATALAEHFDGLRVGVHSEVPVVLGYNWDGGVEEGRCIDQVFTSTLDLGGSRADASRPEFEAICKHLLRAAYLGTLLAAASLGRTTVVLTAIGGGVFGNPHPLIWRSLLWAMDEVDQMGCGGLEVVVNGRNLATHVSFDEIARAVSARAGAIVEFEPRGVSVRR